MHAMLGHGLTTLVHGKRDPLGRISALKFSLLLEPEPTRSLNFSPFFLLFGIHPRLPTDETHRRTLWLRLTTSSRWKKTPSYCQELGGSWTGAIRSQCSNKGTGRSHAQKKHFDETTPDYFFKVGDMVKMKHHDRLKLEFRWKGPYHVVDVGHPGTYWIMTPSRTSTAECSQPNDLAPWLAPVVDNIDFFYDGTNRNTALTGDETSTSH
ncbi:hypothetical protein BASA81_018305 [Batrachochytrium salamandrivorans]|nr:hypothetical protein BASA81_018305 [Batrachochytrium salamandrivorans]